jgi:hypothetical protein
LRRNLVNRIDRVAFERLMTAILNFAGILLIVQ